MADERSLTFRIMHAVAKSDLPSHLRHFVMTLALLADSETGSAYYGQPAIGRAMRKTDRQVRRCFSELEAIEVSPVRVVRRHRGTPDGKGRTSDEWSIVLQAGVTNRTPTSASPPHTGHPRPDEPGPAETPLPDICDSSTGHFEQLNRTPTSGDRLLDRRSDRRESSTSQSSVGSEPFEPTAQSPEQKPSKEESQKRQAKGQATDGAEHQATIAHYFEAFKTKHGREPIIGGEEGSAVKRLLAKLKGDGAEARRRIDIAFASFRGGSVTIRDIPSKPDAFASAEPAKRMNGHAPQQRDANSVNEVIAKAMGGHA